MLVTRVGDRVKAGDRLRHAPALRSPLYTGWPAPKHSRPLGGAGSAPGPNWIRWAIAGATLKFRHDENCAEDYKAVIRKAFI
jgi:hypothetical protein